MRLRETLLSTAAATVMMGGAAYAADIYTAPMAPAPAAPYVAPVTWTGLYGGLQVGGFSGDADYVSGIIR